MAHQSIRIPPDSTGKKIFHRVEVLLSYDNGTVDFTIGDQILCSTSGLTGSILHIEDGSTTASGTIHVLLDALSVEQVVDGENINVDSIFHATVNGTIADGSKYYIPQMMIQGANDTKNVTNVNKYGSLQVEFQDGSPELDGTNRLEVLGKHNIGKYGFPYGLNGLMSYRTSGGGAISYNSNQNVATLSTDGTIGSYVAYRSNVYHKAQPGAAIESTFSLIIGDIGKTGNRRRWGYFDDTAGAFFELDGTNLYIVTRESGSTGSPVDVRIEQQNWNSDHIDGAGGFKNISDFELDITKYNIYWIEVVPRVGTIRFGVYVNGRKITIHQVESNSLTYPVLSRASLPVSYEVEDTGSPLSTSELSICCCAVDIKSDVYKPHFRARGANLNFYPISGSDPKVIYSFRADSTFNGKPNRSVLIPESLTIQSSGGPCAVEFVKNTPLVGSNFIIELNSADPFISDVTGVAPTGGTNLGWWLAGGNNLPVEFKVDDLFELHGEACRSKAWISDTPDHFSIRAKSTTGKQIYVSLGTRYRVYIV